MKRWMLMPPSLLLLGLLVFAFFGRRARQVRAADRDSADMTTAQDLDALRGEVAALKRASNARQIYYVAPVSAPEVRAPAPRESSPEEIAQLAKEKLRDAVNRLEERVATEGVDREWSGKTVRQIQDALTVNALGSHLSKLDCAVSLCRLVLTHDTEEIQRDIANAIGGAEPFQAGVFYDYDRDSKPPKTRLFIARPGANFREEPRKSEP